MEQTVVSALTEDHVARATGLSRGQLRQWDSRGFFKPNYAYDDRKSAFSRIYSFKDVVGLKTINTLREKYKIGFKKLKWVAAELERRGYSHWADTRLYVVKKEVHFQEPETGKVESLENGQLAMLPVIDVIQDVTTKVLELKKRPSNCFGNVEKNKYVTRNSWVVSGTRIPTATIRRYIEAGYTIDDVIEEYPSLTKADIEAALEHEKQIKKLA